MTDTTESVEPAEAPLFQVKVKSPVHLNQTVWIVRKYKVQAEIGVCLCCGGDGEIFGLDKVRYSCPRTMERYPTFWKDCLNGNTTQMSMVWAVYEGKVKAVISKIEEIAGSGMLRQTLSYRVSWKAPLIPEGDWGHFNLEQIGLEIEHQIYTTAEEAEEARLYLKGRDAEEDD